RSSARPMRDAPAMLKTTLARAGTRLDVRLSGPWYTIPFYHYSRTRRVGDFPDDAVAKHRRIGPLRAREIWPRLSLHTSAPGRDRTCCLRIRSPTLYPSELRAHPNVFG